MKAIIGRKVGMSQIFDEKGHVIPVLSLIHISEPTRPY